MPPIHKSRYRSVGIKYAVRTMWCQNTHMGFFFFFSFPELPLGNYLGKGGEI